MSDKKEKDGFLKIIEKIPFIKKLKTIKHIEIIIFVLFILIALLILFGGNFKMGTNSTEKTSVSSSFSTYFSTTDYLKQTEEKLKNVLSRIEGAGNIEVMLSAETSGEIVYAKNTHEETTTDKNSNTVKTVTESIVFINVDGEEKPLILSEILPKINGVVIVAKGASDINVKLNITIATQTLLGLSGDKINVFY